MKGFAKLLFATVRQKIKGILQYPIPAHTSQCVCVCVWVRVCICVYVWLLWPECCYVAGVRLVVPPGRHLTMGRKTPTIRVYPLPHCTSPYFIPLAMRLNNSLTAVCLPFVIGEAFAFAFYLCSSMCGEFFFAWPRIGRVCRFMEIVQYFQCEWGFSVFICILFCVFFCSNFSSVVRL